VRRRLKLGAEGVYTSVRNDFPQNHKADRAADHAEEVGVIPGDVLPPWIPDGVDALSLGVFRAFKTAFQLHHRLLEKALAEKDTHPAAAMCLRLLWDRDGMSQRDLAEVLHLSRPRVTGILQELERSGAVVRSPDERDQRLTRVYLTEGGRSRASEIGGVFAASLSCTIGAMAEGDRRELERLLNILAENTSRAIEDETWRVHDIEGRRADR
jgi:DNA-binding MarR family transcriptional regulator